MWQFWGFRSHARWILPAEVNRQPPIHQLRMRQFKPFWGWTKNPSSSPAQGFFSPLLGPKFSPPTYLCPSCLPPPLLPTPPPPTSLTSFPFTPSRELSITPKLELHRASQHTTWGRWRAQRCRNMKSSTLKEHITNLPPTRFSAFTTF